MKKVNGLSRNTLSDKCRTSSQIINKLECLASELPSSVKIETISEKGACNQFPVLLSNLKYSELKSLDQPVRMLSEICRLLIKLGTTESFRCCQGLSHKIYEFQTTHHESWYVSNLYKGVSQIGNGNIDIGIKNVLIGISDYSEFTAMPIDKAIGYRALATAAVVRKNLRMALEFIGKWHRISKRNGLDGEIAHSKIVIHIFDLLYGNRNDCMKGINELKRICQAEWAETLTELSHWTDDVVHNRHTPPAPFSNRFCSHGIQGISGKECHVPGQRIVCRTGHH